MTQLGVRVRGITIENVWRVRRVRRVWYKASCSLWSRQWMELGPFVAVLLRITYDLEHYMSQSWDASRLRWAKSHDNLATSFVYMLLMGGCREMKTVQLLYTQAFRPGMVWYLKVQPIILIHDTCMIGCNSEKIERDCLVKALKSILCKILRAFSRASVLYRVHTDHASVRNCAH